MASYTVIFREEIIKKVLSSDREDSIRSISEKSGVTTRTIHRWVTRHLNQLPFNQHLSDLRKIDAVLENINIPIEVKSMFCREHGIMLEDLNEWELDLKNSLSGGAVSKFEYGKLNAEKKELEKLLASKEKELTVKDKALAEAAALLDLQKKIQKLLEKEGVNLS